MSAAVLCGNKRSFVEELLPPPNLTKRFRCSTSATITFCAPYLLEHLRSIFPLMDTDVLLRTLEECGYNVDVAIDMLQQLHLGSHPEKNPVFAEESDDNVAKSEPELAPPENHSAPSNLPKNVAEWVDLFVKEMMSSSSVDDAKGRAAKVLEVFEKFVRGRAGEEAAQSVKEENMELKQKVEGVVKVNTVLKQAVMILHKRQKEYEDRKREFEHLKLLVSQYQEQVKALEVNNYALTLHLKQAQQTSCIPASFHPHVF